MIKHIGFVLLFSIFSCQFGDSPKVFSEVALSDKLITLNGKEITLASVLDKNKGKALVIGFWASWCKDCM